MSRNEKKNAQFSGTFKTKNQTIEVRLVVILFNEGDTSIAYCPEVNVYGYGRDEAEARQSFEVALNEFFGYTLNKKTLVSELEALGWTVKSRKKFTPPTFSSLLDKNDDFRDIFNNRDFTKFSTGVSLPLPA